MRQADASSIAIGHRKRSGGTGPEVRKIAAGGRFGRTTEIGKKACPNGICRREILYQPFTRSHVPVISSLPSVT
jgi:hypothetical protein